MELKVNVARYFGDFSQTELSSAQRFSLFFWRQRSKGEKILDPAGRSSLQALCTSALCFCQLDVYSCHKYYVWPQVWPWPGFLLANNVALMPLAANSLSDSLCPSFIIAHVSHFNDVVFPGWESESFNCRATWRPPPGRSTDCAWTSSRRAPTAPAGRGRRRTGADRRRSPPPPLLLCP